MNLTDAKAKRIVPDSTPVPDGTVAGLRLHPGNQKGNGKWLLRFTSPETHKRRDMGLGTSPITIARFVRSELSGIFIPPNSDIVRSDHENFYKKQNTSVSPPSSPTDVETLNRLRDNGLITDTEYRNTLNKKPN